MKKLSLFLALCLLLTGCGNTVAEVTPAETRPQAPATLPPAEPVAAAQYESRFTDVTEIRLGDEGIAVNGGGETDAVYTSHDIIYYEDRDAYESGNPYGEGEAWQRHSAQEAQAHTVVNITAPGAYRVTGRLSAGQIRVDLGEEAASDPGAVVELILADTDITCTVAPAILFLNVYECDGGWSVETAKANIDTSAAGANLILEGENTVNGSHVAKVYKDKEGEKKLWKQDGAIYSYQSLNVYGPGSLALNADNEGMDTELHLTIHGGSIAIRSGNDGINTNEDGVSVTTINGGELRILAGLDKEGDGIDSNGYLVINGGSVISSAHPAADAGLDSDMGSFIHGGTVIALGSTMDWAESDSRQVTMNLQFQSGTAGKLEIRQGNSTVFSFDAASDDVLREASRNYRGAVISCPSFNLGETYQVYADGAQQSYTGTDVGMGFPGGFGGFGGFGGGMPGQPGEGRPGRGEGEMPDFAGEGRPEGGNFPGEGQFPGGGHFPGGGQFPGESQFPGEGQFPGGGEAPSEGSATDFYLTDKVNAFSGLMPA